MSREEYYAEYDKLRKLYLDGELEYAAFIELARVLKSKYYRALYGKNFTNLFNDMFGGVSSVPVQKKVSHSPIHSFKSLEHFLLECDWNGIIVEV